MDEQDQPNPSLLPDDFEAVEDSLPPSDLSLYEFPGLHDLDNSDQGLLEYFWPNPMGNNERIESALDQPADSEPRLYPGTPVSAQTTLSPAQYNYPIDMASPGVRRLPTTNDEEEIPHGQDRLQMDHIMQDGLTSPTDWGTPERSPSRGGESMHDWGTTPLPTKIDCPWFRAAMIRHLPRTCRNPLLKNMSDVRRHAARGQRRHLPFLKQCQTCKKLFLDRNVFDSRHGDEGELCTDEAVPNDPQAQWKQLYAIACGQLDSMEGITKPIELQDHTQATPVVRPPTKSSTTPQSALSAEQLGQTQPQSQANRRSALHRAAKNRESPQIDPSRNHTYQYNNSSRELLLGSGS